MYNNAKQNSNQITQSFDFYLNKLKTHISKFTSEQLYSNYFAKLQFELKTNNENYEIVSNIRIKMIVLIARLNRNDFFKIKASFNRKNRDDFSRKFNSK